MRFVVKVDDAIQRDTSWSQSPETKKWETIYAYKPAEEYKEPLAEQSPSSQTARPYLGNIVLNGELPSEGSVIRIRVFKPIRDGSKYSLHLTGTNLSDKESGRERIEEITVFPNPYMGYNPLERGRESRFMRFTGMPTEATVRIYTLAGVFVRRIDKNEYVQWLDWDMRNENGNLVSSGIYIAHIEMPGIGEKILKLAVVMERQYLDRR